MRKITMDITSDTQITCCIDWLSVTNDQENRVVGATRDFEMLSRGMMGYPEAAKYADGSYTLKNPLRSDMKVHQVYSGKAIRQQLDDCDMNQATWLHRAAVMGTATRIDVAVDVVGGALDIPVMAAMVRAGKHRTSAKTALFLEGLADKSATLYIGSPKSPQRLRIYDKAKEQKIEGLQWTRVELQLRKHHAQRMVEQLIMVGPWSESIPQRIKAYCDFPEYRPWLMVMGHVTGELPLHISPPSNTEAWLIRVVAKAMARAIFNAGNWQVFKKFKEAVNAEYLDLLHVAKTPPPITPTDHPPF